MLTYSELILYETFEDRMDYLATDSRPSEITFGALRFLNQAFYNSRQWKHVRLYVIARDLGFDLSIPGRTIFGKTIVHHMNPLLPKDIYDKSEISLSPEFLITVSHSTHQGIHFGRVSDIPFEIERVKGDTKLW